jgi:hypothetical protein
MKYVPRHDHEKNIDKVSMKVETIMHIGKIIWIATNTNTNNPSRSLIS